MQKWMLSISGLCWFSAIFQFYAVLIMHLYKWVLIGNVNNLVIGHIGYWSWNHGCLNLKIFKQSCTKSSYFTLGNVTCYFSNMNQQDLIYCVKYSIEILCYNIGRCECFTQYLSTWNKTKLWLLKSQCWGRRHHGTVDEASACCAGHQFLLCFTSDPTP